MPNTMSAVPSTTRSQDAQVGGDDLWDCPSTPDPAPKRAVNAASPNSQPPRNARPVGRGRGACNTSTAGMMVSGETATTSPSGMSPVSNDPALPATGSNPLIDTAAVPPIEPGRPEIDRAG